MNGGFNLDTFYQSGVWVNLMEVIRMERLTDKGDIICEYCGEPIVHKYDCIGHHKEPLDENNVNDAMISLNPENVMLVHHKCHNRIHGKLRYGEDVRQVYLVYGPPLSGKTSWVKDNMNAGDLVVDIENIWQCVSGLDSREKPGRLKACVFGVRDTLLDMVRYRRGKWLNAYVVGGYPLVSERERLCNMLRAREVFINTSREECVRRLLESDGCDQEEWMKYINDWWKQYAPRTYS